MIGENPFLDEIAKDNRIKEDKIVNKSDKKNQSKKTGSPASNIKKGRGRPRVNPDAPEETKTYLYRTSPEYYAQLQMFCALAGTTVNSLIDDALKLFLNNKSNAELFEIAKKHAVEKKVK